MTISPPATLPMPERNTWHRHPIVLVRAIFVPALGLLVLLAVLVVYGATSTPARIALGLGSVVLIFQGVQAGSGVPKEVAGTPLSQRENVLQRVSRPYRILLAVMTYSLAAVTFVLLLMFSVSPGASPAIMQGLFIVWFVAIAFWLTMNTVDWRNDVYILTQDRIIDQVRFPILYDQRTDARLDQVQNVRYQQGALGRILNFGDVTVETAGRTQAVVFLQVPKPAGIQSTIFQRIDQLTERLAREESLRQREQLSVWFAAYHDLAGRIEVLSMPETVPAQHTARPEWRINVDPDTRYETWIAHDTVSHARDNEYKTKTAPQPGQGRRRFRAIVPTPQSGYLYLKIWLKVFAAPGSGQQDEEFATREFAITVV